MYPLAIDPEERHFTGNPGDMFSLLHADGVDNPLAKYTSDTDRYCHYHIGNRSGPDNALRVRLGSQLRDG